MSDTTKGISMESSTELNQNIKKLNHTIQKQISFKRAILLALAQGAAGAIGATVVAGIIITILVHTVGKIPSVHQFFENLQTQSQK